MAPGMTADLTQISDNSTIFLIVLNGQPQNDKAWSNVSISLAMHGAPTI